MGPEDILESLLNSASHLGLIPMKQTRNYQMSVLHFSNGLAMVRPKSQRSILRIGATASCHYQKLGLNTHKTPENAQKNLFQDLSHPFPSYTLDLALDMIADTFWPDFKKGSKRETAI